MFPLAGHQPTISGSVFGADPANISKMSSSSLPRDDLATKRGSVVGTDPADIPKMSSSSPPRDDLDEISQISKQLTQARKELNKQGRVVKECEQLKTALAESKHKEEEVSERLEEVSEKLIDAEEEVSKWKRLATKYKEQSVPPKVDTALVEELQAKVKAQASELLQTQEELKKANERLDNARTSLKSLLTSEMKAVIGAVLNAELEKLAVSLKASLPGAIEDSIAFSLSQLVLEQEQLEVEESSASGMRVAKSTLMDPPSASPIFIPTRKVALSSQCPSPLQDPEPPRTLTKTVPALPATETQVQTSVSAPPAEPSLEKPQTFAAAVQQTVDKPKRLVHIGDNIDADYHRWFTRPKEPTPIRPDASFWGLPDASFKKPTQIVADNSQTGTPVAKESEAKQQDQPLTESSSAPKLQTSVSAPPAEPSSRKSQTFAATVRQLDSGFDMGANLHPKFSIFSSTKALFDTWPKQIVADNSQTGTPVVESESEGTKRRGSPSQSPKKRQKR